MNLAESQKGGILLAVEGVDGAGKTTQVEMFRNVLERAGERPILSKESPDRAWRTHLTEHVETVIRPALNQGKIVILNQYLYSSVAYLGARGADPQGLRSMMESLFPVPDGTFIIDIDPVLGTYRTVAPRGEVRSPLKERDELMKARAIFQSIIGDTIHHIDGTLSALEVHRRILNAFIDGPLKARRCAKHYGCEDPFHCSWALSNACAWWRLSRALHSAEVVVA